MKKNKGWIALDIDGTITEELHEMPEQVADYLQTLAVEGWRVMFITGRIFSFAHSVLKTLQFPYYVALQNGADILEMPKRRLVSRSYLQETLIPELERAYLGCPEDFIVYAGYDHGDFCYYRPHHFSPNIQDYLGRLKSLSAAPWKEVEHFEDLDQKEFSLVKCFGGEEMMRSLQARLELIPDVEATLIRDTINPNFYLILITSRLATKGAAIDRIIASEDGEGLVIAAGDDLNDVTMFKRADISIVMETAPKELLEHADIVAESASKFGIIQALREATKR